MKRKCLGVFLVSLFLGISPCIAQAQEDQILYSETKYFKTVEDNMGLMYTTTEITEEEYIAAQGVSLMGSYFNTNYKRLTIGASSNNVNLDLQWTAVPAVKSYDVIALRGEGIKFNTSTLTGNQSYMKDGSYGAVAYTKDSNNTKLFSEGAGISMNIVDGATNFNIHMDMSYYKTGSSGHIYGTYQHAVKDVSLAQSHSYSLSASGYGKVALFTSDVRDYYDGMNGVDISV